MMQAIVEAFLLPLWWLYTHPASIAAWFSLAVAIGLVRLCIRLKREGVK